MLKGIIEEDDVCLGLLLHELLDAMTTVFIYSYSDVGVVLHELPRLVTNILNGALWCGFEIALGLALVSTTEGRHMQSLCL